MRIPIVLACVFGSLMQACAPSQFVVPLKKGEQAVNASFGGPLVNVPGIATIPIPFTSVGYGYGLSNKTTLSGALYPTAAIYGDFQLNAAVLHQFWTKDKYSVTGKLGFDYMVDVYEKTQRIWPQLDGNFAYTYQNSTETQKRKLVCLGFSNWFELNKVRAHGEKQETFLFFNPHIGHQMKRNNWAFHFEIAFLASNLKNDKVALDYKSVFGKNGATGIYFGLQYHFQ